MRNKDDDIKNEGWKIAAIKKTGELIPYQPLKKQARPRRSVVVASFLSEDDMLQYIQMKKMGVEADGIAYIAKEHEYLAFPNERLSKALDDLAEKVEQVKKDSSRVDGATGNPSLLNIRAWRSRGITFSTLSAATFATKEMS